EDVRLVHQRDLATTVTQRVLECVAHHALGTLPGHHCDRLRAPVRIVTHRHPLLQAYVETLEVLANEHDVDVVVATARNQVLGGTHVGVERELLPQRDVHRPETAAHRRGERALERQSGAPDAVECCLRQRIAGGFNRCDTAELAIPVELEAGRLQDANRGCGDLRADSVTGDQGHVNAHSWLFDVWKYVGEARSECRTGTARVCHWIAAPQHRTVARVDQHHRRLGANATGGVGHHSHRGRDKHEARLGHRGERAQV